MDGCVAKDPTASCPCFRNLKKPTTRHGFPGYVTMANDYGIMKNPWNATETQIGCSDFGNGNIGCGSQYNALVQYCLSEQVPRQCKLSLVPVFLIICCVCNAATLVAFLWTRKVVSKGEALVTQGDAIQSFLDVPDEYLKGICLATKDDFLEKSGRIWDQRGNVNQGNLGQVVGGTIRITSEEHSSGRKSWGRASRSGHWMLTYALVAGYMIAVGVLFASLKMPSDSLAPDNYAAHPTWDIVASQGLGQPLPAFSKGHGKSPVLSALFVANTPQLFIAYLYVDIRSLVTTMSSMAEWTSYYAAPEAKGLRVSRPVQGSAQTSAYYLTTPISQAALRLSLFIVLHWLTSEMLFVARVESYTTDGQLSSANAPMQVYYSPSVTLCIIGLLGTIMIVLAGIAFFARHPAHAPLAGNCSSSIAAACRPVLGESTFEPGLAREKLRWGVVTLPQRKEDLGHATFSDGPVGPLIPGMRYA